MRPARAQVLRQVQHAPSSTSLIAMVRGLSALQVQCCCSRPVPLMGPWVFQKGHVSPYATNGTGFLRALSHFPSSAACVHCTPRPFPLNPKPRVLCTPSVQSGYLDLVFEEVAAAMQLQIDLPAQRACSPAATPDVSGACQEVQQAIG